MNKLGICVGWGMAFGIVFLMASFIFYSSESARHEFVFCFGFFVGIVSAPEFHPKLFKKTAVYQTLGGAVAGAFGAIAFFPNVEVVVLGLILGGILGWLAPYWIDRIQIP